MINLKEIEKTSWTSVFQSGLVDIEIGLILIVSFALQSFSTAIDNVRFYFYLLYFVPALFYIIAYKYVITPRQGLVKFSKERKKRSRLLFIIMTTSIVILLVLTTMEWIQLIPNAGMIIGAIVFLIPTLIAYFLNFNRMYIYAVLMTASFALNEYTITKTGSIESGAYAWLITAIIILVIGTVLFVKFIKKYSLPKKNVQ
jgi:hypothetical protein